MKRVLSHLIFGAMVTGFLFGSCECGRGKEEVSPPDTTITYYPPNPTNSTTAAFEFTCIEGSCRFECELDGGGYSACTSPKIYTALSEGSHTFKVRAIDLAGNVDSSLASYSWIIELGTWRPTTTTDAPSGRYAHTAVWTGSEMIVWGGGSYLNTGGIYTP